MGSGPNAVTPNGSAIQKRSFRRAAARVLRHGATWYRGRMVTVDSFPASLLAQLRDHSPRPALRGRSAGHSHVPHGRFSLLQWNPGGLAQGSFLELRLWLRANPVDLVVLSETRWSFTSTWQDDHWAYVHSAAQEPGTGGLLVMISRRIIHPDHIGFLEHIAGRLLHVRLHFASRNLDLLAAYQYVDNRTASQRAKRTQFWHALDSGLSSLPLRNQLICTGDFNSSLPGQAPWLGTSHFKHQGCRASGTSHPDMSCFFQIIQKHSLTALNGWDESQGPTYVHGTHASRIDFVFTRLHQCDGLAKHPQLLRHAEFLPWNSTHHIPILCTFRKHHVQYHVYHSGNVCTYNQRAQCRQAQQQDLPAWHTLNDHVQDELWANLTRAPPSGQSVIDLHAHVVPLFGQLFPSKKPHGHKPQYQEAECAIQTKWYHKKALMCLGAWPTSQPLLQLFQAWYHWSRFVILRKSQQKLARRARTDRFRLLCAEVELASVRHDAHTMFSIINQFSPRKPIAKTRLRTAAGGIADQWTAHSMIVDYVTRTWQGPDETLVTSESAPGVPFSKQDIALAVSALHSNKAVAPQFLPALVWKGHPFAVAEFLYQCLDVWWNTQPLFIPSVWKDAWLTFLPKPGKPCTSPDQLRPISLMEPLGKLVVGLLADQTKLQLSDVLCQFPQFGFLPMRAATDAIARVASHCREVRLLVAAQRRSVLQQMASPPQFTTCGGVQLFLDLNRAFDSVHRLLLFNHLRDIGLSDHLHLLVTKWHEGTHYNLQFQGQTTRIPVKIGLRQGCKIAPLLWVVFMDKFLHLLAPLTGVQWIEQALTLYADDIHAGCVYHSSLELATALKNFGHMLDTLESMQLQLSYNKSFLIFAVAGSNYRRAVKDHMTHGAAGRMLLLPRCNGHKTALPIKAVGKYLGVLMSYRNFEETTWRLRKKAGWSAFLRLQPWFKQRGIQRHNKIHLWQSCIFSILTYGIFSTNVTVKVLQEFQSTYYHMMRIVIGDHAYCTHHTHQQAFHTLGIEQPLTHLLRVATQTWHRLCQRTTQLKSHDFLRRVDWTHLLDVMQLIRQVHIITHEAPMHPDVHADSSMQAMYRCQECDFVTHTLANLRRHAPGHAQPDRPALEPVVESQRYSTDLFMVKAKPFWQRLCQIVQARSWTDLDQTPDIGTYLAHNCMICGVWLNRCQELHQHYRLYHGDWETGIHAKSAQITKILSSPSPCSLCGKHFKRGHACPVATQLAALQLYAFPESSTQADSLKCDVCNVSFENKGSLHVHLHSEHNLQVHLWNPARDCLPHSDACAHCGALFATRDGVRRHILDGRCVAFNPDAPTIMPTALPRWENVLRTGAISRVGLAAIDRQHLTLVCQLCSTSYSRTADLMQHLQQSHSSLWTQALPMVRYLLQTVASREGCLCNPTATDQGHTHICALVRQLSMLFVTSQQELLIPRTFVSCQVLDHFQHVGAHDAMKVIAHMLETRRFEDLWQTPEILQFLRTHCILCGGVFHPGALVQHSYCWHASPVQWATQLAFQLAPLLIQMQPQDHLCIFCGLVFNLPSDHDPAADELARTELMQVHFNSNCPVLLQLLLLLQPLPDRPDVHSGCPRQGAARELTRAGAADDSGRQVQKRRRRGTPQQASQAGTGRVHGSDLDGPPPTGDSQISSHDPAAHPNQSGPSTRTQPAAAAQTGLLRYVRAGRPGGSSATVGPIGRGMERSSGQVHGSPSVVNIEDSPPPRIDAGASEAPSTDGQFESGRPSLGPCSQSRPADERRELALSEVEQGDTATGEGPQDSVGNAAGFERDPIHHRPPCGFLTCAPLPFTPTTGEDDSMATSNQPQARRLVENDGVIGAVHGLELTGDIPQNPQSTAEPASCPSGCSNGQRSSDAPEGPEQGQEAQSIPERSMNDVRQRLRQAAAQMIFDNDGTLCYANCAVISYIWACLSRSSFQLTNWGAQSELFLSLLMDNLESPVLLTQHDWFTSLTQAWPERGRQADSAEFTGRLMAWVASRCHSQQWQRRVMLGQRVTIHDYGDQFLPLTVQLDPSLCQDYGLRLDTLIRHWSGELGMTAAFTGRPDLICVQVDRLNQTPLGTLQKLRTPITFYGPVDIPVFVSDGSTDCEWVSYGMTAAVAHTGDVSSGHYQALLHTAPVPWYEGVPVQWLHCDDHRAPVPRVDIPPGFQEGVTCIWMCRVDLIELHNLPRIQPSSNDGDSFLAMFSSSNAS
eukprot:s4865_g3.t1